MKTVAFCTLGCKVNQYETQAMEQQFLRNGYSIVEFNESADIYIVNTCTVTNMSDKKSRQMLRKTKQLNKNSIVIAVRMLCSSIRKRVRKNRRDRYYIRK